MTHFRTEAFRQSEGFRWLHGMLEAKPFNEPILCRQ